jgi:CDP-4-dehydro-6-deoxyglucose reductase, E3
MTQREPHAAGASSAQTTDAGDAPGCEDVPFTVVAKRSRTPAIVELTLRPLDHPIDYQAGQYVLLGDTGYTRPPRSYSAANAPLPDATIDLLVTLVPDGEVSPWVHHHLHPGDEVLVSGAYGTFVDEHEDGRPRLYVAGGSGLAPVRALAEAALRQPEPPPMTLRFSARTTDDLIDDLLFRRWQRDCPNFRYLRTLTRSAGPPPVGHIPDVLPELLPSLDTYLVYIAGGSGFVADCEKAVRRQGAEPGRVFTEEFFADPRPWGGNETQQGGR